MKLPPVGNQNLTSNVVNRLYGDVMCIICALGMLSAHKRLNGHQIIFAALNGMLCFCKWPRSRAADTGHAISAQLRWRPDERFFRIRPLTKPDTRKVPVV